MFKSTNKFREIRIVVSRDLYDAGRFTVDNLLLCVSWAFYNLNLTQQSLTNIGNTQYLVYLLRQSVQVVRRIRRGEDVQISRQTQEESGSVTPPSPLATLYRRTRPVSSCVRAWPGPSSTVITWQAGGLETQRSSPAR